MAAAAARLGFLVCLLAALAPARAGAIEDPAANTRTTTLANGLTVLTLEDHTTPVVSFQLWVRVGSKDEMQYSGLAHLFEHMMFKGSEHLAPERHAQILEARGARSNAFTSRDVTVYFADVTPEALPLVIELEAERLAHLTIDEATLSSEREVVLEERRLRSEDNPNGLGFEALFALAFRAHPYRRPVIGWRSDVEAVDVEACRAFFRNFYAPNNIVIAVTGAFDSEDTLARIERAFGGLPGVLPIPRNPTLEREQRGERRETVLFDLRSPLVFAAWHTPATGHPDAEPLDVLSSILSDGRSSRLYRRLVREEQQALDASGGYWELQEAGLFLAWIGVRPDASAERAERLLFEEIDRLRETRATEEELEKAKRQIEVSLLRGLRTNHALGHRIASEYVSLGRIRPLDERLEAIRRVTLEDVERVARTYLREDGRSVVRVVAPPAAPDAAGPS
ncbi:MAG: insulinase family protein [Deltaproteobacteria bacterium]|nr:MAG: insulinase family protein [Deltaproteobacteria bacterium]